jgi:hypothetical protein
VTLDFRPEGLFCEACLSLAQVLASG